MITVASYDVENLWVNTSAWSSQWNINGWSPSRFNPCLLQIEGDTHNHTFECGFVDSSGDPIGNNNPFYHASIGGWVDNIAYNASTGKSIDFPKAEVFMTRPGISDYVTYNDWETGSESTQSLFRVIDDTFSVNLHMFVVYNKSYKHYNIYYYGALVAPRRDMWSDGYHSFRYCSYSMEHRKVHSIQWTLEQWYDYLWPTIHQQMSRSYGWNYYFEENAMIKLHMTKPLDMLAVEQYCYQRLCIDNAHPPELPVDWGELGQQAGANLQYWDGNMPAYARDLRILADSILDFAELIKGKKTPKNLADIYLSDKYGLKLTANDTVALLDAIDGAKKATEMRYRRVQALATNDVGPWVVHQYYTVDYDPFDSFSKDFLKQLSDFDALPTLSNLWDLVPYSFVIDWFIDIGGALEQYEIDNKWAKLQVRCVTYTSKCTKPVIYPGDARSQLELTIYNRKLSSQVHKPQLFNSEPRYLNHVPELSALLIQRTGKH